MNNQELPRRALDLSLAIYRVTAKFPQGEVLVAQLRRLANDVAVKLGSAGDSERIKKDIERLRIYFQIAKAQNWVRPINWSVLDFEYHKLQQEVIFACRGFTRRGEQAADPRGKEERGGSIMSHNIREVKKDGKGLSRQNPVNLPLRQDRILKIVKNKGLVKMSDLTPLFKDEISERTLRNELQIMVAGGLIKKSGVNKTTEYSRA